MHFIMVRPLDPPIDAVLEMSPEPSGKTLRARESSREQSVQDRAPLLTLKLLKHLSIFHFTVPTVKIMLKKYYWS